MIKKLLIMMLSASLVFSFGGCGGDSASNGDADPGSGNGSAAFDDAGDFDGLRVLTEEGRATCSTENGCYYITEDSSELKDGSYAKHLMYMDYAAQQEIYLCSTSGCAHDTENCPAVLSDKAFPLYSSYIFVHENKLYLLNTDYDTDGQVTMSFDGMGGDSAVETLPSSLYCMNLDGTNREKAYTFDAGLVFEETILADESSICFITKEVENKQTDNSTYTTSTNRQLLRYAPSKKQAEVVQSLDFGDDIDWKVIGAFDGSLVLEGVSYADKVSQEEEFSMSDGEWRDYYNQSKTVFAVFDLENGMHSEVASLDNDVLHSQASEGGILYFSDETSKAIQQIDLRTGETTKLADLAQNYVLDVFSDTLLCTDLDSTEDPSLYFVDRKTGEVSKCELTNKCTGWMLDVAAETEYDYLVINDYDAESLGDDTYEIYQYKYALISKANLYAGKGNYRQIAMVGKGI